MGRRCCVHTPPAAQSLAQLHCPKPSTAALPKARLSGTAPPVLGRGQFTAKHPQPAPGTPSCSCPTRRPTELPPPQCLQIPAESWAGAAWDPGGIDTSKTCTKYSYSKNEVAVRSGLRSQRQFARAAGAAPNAPSAPLHPSTPRCDG